MTEFIVLSLADVDKLFPVDPKTGSREKATSPGHAICPVALEGGTEFILPLEVLSDPKHAATLDDLKTHKDAPLDLKSPSVKREVAPQEFKVSTLEAQAAEAEGSVKP